VAGIEIQRPGPVDKLRPNTDAFEQDATQEAVCELVIAGSDAPLLLEMANDALAAPAEREVTPVTTQLSLRPPPLERHEFVHRA
jgi:hypothetical protein